MAEIHNNKIKARVQALDFIEKLRVFGQKYVNGIIDQKDFVKGVDTKCINYLVKREKVIKANILPIEESEV